MNRIPDRPNRPGERLPVFQNRVKNQLGHKHYLFKRIGDALAGRLSREDYLDSLDRLAYFELRSSDSIERAFLGCFRWLMIVIDSIIVSIILSSQNVI